jgi:hypothetical protein
MPELRKAFLGWTILQNSCELGVFARELGDDELITLVDEVTQQAARHLGASRTLVERMRHDLATRPAKRAR